MFYLSECLLMFLPDDEQQVCRVPSKNFKWNMCDNYQVLFLKACNPGQRGEERDDLLVLQFTAASRAV